MEKIKTFLTWLLKKPWYTVFGLGLAATLALVLLTLGGCSTWKGASLSGVHKTEKNVKDSIRYESSWSK